MRLFKRAFALLSCMLIAAGVLAANPGVVKTDSAVEMCSLAPATCDVVLAGNGDGWEPPLPKKKRKK